MFDLTSILSGVVVGVAGWIALNLVGKPVLALHEKRREALEAAERYAYVGLHCEPSEKYSERALIALFDAGNALRGYSRERALAIRLYCLIRGYDVGLAGSALLGLGEAAHGEIAFSERTRRLNLHAAFVALGATHHLTAEEIALARREIAAWHDGHKNSDRF